MTVLGSMQLLAQSDDTAIGERLNAALAEVEARFSAELISDLPCVNSLVGHVERYRGKMMRPTLVLLSGMACSGSKESLNDSHLVVATVTEMVHMATLVHDDILDEAQVRRGGGTINHLRGNEAAVMLGDYLISHAYHLCSSLDSNSPSRAIAQTTNTVCEGELLQLANRGNADLDERTYFEIIRRKTGSLCGMCCQLGAEFSDATDAVAQCMYQYGENLGIAFQIIDDLLDLIGAEQTVGKTLGKDLQKGKLTLPLIHCLGHSDAKTRQRLIKLLTPNGDNGAGHEQTGNGHDLEQRRAQEVRDLIRGDGSMQYANQWADRLIAQAKAAVGVLEVSPTRELLLAMADAVLTRKF